MNTNPNGKSWLIAILLSVVCVPSVFGGLKTADQSERDALVAAITSYTWTWEEVASGIKKTEDIDFYRNGIAEEPTLRWTAQWDVAAPRVLILESLTRRGGARYVGHKAYLVFDASLTHFIGFDLNGKTTVEGVRREAVDPKRLPSE